MVTPAPDTGVPEPSWRTLPLTATARVNEVSNRVVLAATTGGRLPYGFRSDLRCGSSWRGSTCTASVPSAMAGRTNRPLVVEDRLGRPADPILLGRRVDPGPGEDRQSLHSPEVVALDLPLDPPDRYEPGDPFAPFALRWTDDLGAERRGCHPEGVEFLRGDRGEHAPTLGVDLDRDGLTERGVEHQPSEPGRGDPGSGDGTTIRVEHTDPNPMGWPEGQLDRLAVPWASNKGWAGTPRPSRPERPRGLSCEGKRDPHPRGSAG